MLQTPALPTRRKPDVPDTGRRCELGRLHDNLFAPSKPADVKDGNWIQTTPGKGWFTLLRLYSPKESILPQRPAGTEHLNEEELAALVTRDAMIGVTLVRSPTHQTIDSGEHRTSR